MFNLADSKLEKLLPPILLKDSDIRAICFAVNEEFKLLANEIDRVLFIPMIDGITNEALLDELAYQFHVDFYDSSFAIEVKRRLVKDSYRNHRIKGTPGAVEDLIDTVFGSGQVEEWFDYGGDPYYFRVSTMNQEAVNERAEEFIRAVNTVKNARSYLESVIIISTEQLNLYLGGIMQDGNYEEYR